MTQPIGGVACEFFHDPAWCEEVGYCNSGHAPRSSSADWKVASVSVLTPNGLDTPLRTAPKTVAVAAVAKRDGNSLTRH